MKTHPPYDAELIQKSPTVFTVGHSTLDITQFLNLLKRHGIMALADVRSVPYSRYHPHFNRDVLSRSLKESDIAYVFLGKELGARPEDRSCYRGNIADYDLIAATSLFQNGLDRIVSGCKKYKIVLMCAEKDPLSCHRTILVGRHLITRGIKLVHILSDGRVENHHEAERRLLSITKEDSPTMFDTASDGDPLVRAYTKRGKEIAYIEPLECHDE